MASLWPAKSAKGSCPISSRPRRRGRSSSSRMRIGRQSSPRFLQYGDGELPTHRREVVQKNFQSVPCFEMVKQGLDWYASTAKHRGSAVNLGVNGDQLSVQGDSTKSSRRVVYFQVSFCDIQRGRQLTPASRRNHACLRTQVHRHFTTCQIGSFAALVRNTWLMRLRRTAGTSDRDRLPAPYPGGPDEHSAVHRSDARESFRRLTVSISSWTCGYLRCGVSAPNERPDAQPVSI